jgi:hypothetical protein
MNIEKDNLNVRVITSDRAGVGKSLYIKRLVEHAKEAHKPIRYQCISIKKQTLPFETIFQSLKKFDQENASPDETTPKIVHIDIAYEVWYEVDYFLFNLLCLGILTSSNGQIYRRSPSDLFLIEIMSPKIRVKEETSSSKQDDDSDLDFKNSKPLHSILTVLPTLYCLTPTETFNLIKECKEIPSYVCPILFDQNTLTSDLIQRPCQYLNLSEILPNFDKFSYNQGQKQLNVKSCLELLLKHLENKNPSWSEIIHFASFLNTQLIDCENSAFCS